MPGGFDRLFLESVPFTMAVLLWAGIVGLAMGGLLMLVSWRLTHGEHVLSGPSHCDWCGRVLSLRDIVPLVGWLRLKGRCPECGYEVPLTYPLGELVCSLVFVTATFRYGFTPEGLQYLLLGCVLFVATCCDLSDYTIPNALVFVGLGIRVAYLAYVAIAVDVGQALTLCQDSVVGALVVAGPFALAVFLAETLMAREVFGGADINMLALLGAYLGWQQGLVGVAAVTLLWVLGSLVLLRTGVDVWVRGNPNIDDPLMSPFADPSDIRLEVTADEDIAEPLQLVPLGPAIAVVLWGLVLVGIPIPAWYVALL